MAKQKTKKPADKSESKSTLDVQGQKVDTSKGIVKGVKDAKEAAKTKKDEARGGATAQVSSEGHQANPGKSSVRVMSKSDRSRLKQQEKHAKFFEEQARKKKLSEKK